MTIALIPMEVAEYDRFLKWLVDDLAADIERADHMSRYQAGRDAGAQLDRLLTDGLRTPGHTFLSIGSIEAGSSPVGWLWFGARSLSGEQVMWLYEIVVFEAHRRRGYGSSALSAVEDQARAAGLGRVALHVFQHNHEAIEFYRTAGYETDRTEPGHVLMARGVNGETV